MNYQQREWVRQQVWFDYMIESQIVITKCGKRFEDFADLKVWAESKGK